MAVDTQYAYAVARIRVIENKLLDKNKLDRMLEAKTPIEAMKVLDEAGYESPGDENSNPHEYEKLLKEEQKKVYRLLKSMAPQPEVFNLFLYKNDYHNIKVMLKSEFSGTERDDILVDTGSIALNSLKLMIRDRNLREMSETMRLAVEDCIDTYNRTGDSQIIDIILDRACFKEMLEAAEKTENRFVSEYVKMQIDLLNIKNFVRVKKMNKSWDFLDKVLLEGGNIDSKLFLKKYGDSFESFVDEAKFTPYGSLCETGIGDFLATGSLTKLEKLIDDEMMSYIKKSKFIALGIEPLIAYLVAKETEVRNVGIIMIGKINGIPGEIIKERLREAYV